MGRRHARVLLALGDRFELVGVFDSERSRAERARDEIGTLVLASEREAIESSEVVLVATPSEIHVRTATAALDAGRDVLIEKPICARVDDARTVLAAASRARRRVFVGHSERFNPVVRAVARLLRGDEVVALAFHRIGAGRAVTDADVGVLANLGVHDLDLAAYLTGGAVGVSDAIGRSFDGSAGYEDMAHVLVAAHGRALGHIYADRTASVKHRSLRLTTTRWVYEGDLLDHRLARTARGSTVSGEIPLTTEEPLVAQAIALADALDGTPSREIATGIDGLRALALADEAAQRIRERESFAPAEAENL
jgi:predicted dehydrogenase